MFPRGHRPSRMRACKGRIYGRPGWNAMGQTTGIPVVIPPAGMNARLPLARGRRRVRRKRLNRRCRNVTAMVMPHSRLTAPPRSRVES